jgi:adenylylsulfate kinase-like enzyme
LNGVRNSIKAKFAASHKQIKCLAITGMKGSGKSSLANAYAYQGVKLLPTGFITKPLNKLAIA